MLEERFCDDQILRVGDLDVGGFAFYDDHLRTGSREQLGVVWDLIGDLRVRPSKCSGDEALRRLNGNQMFALDARPHPLAVRLLQRVRYRKGGYHSLGVALEKTLDDPIHQTWRGQRPGGIVDEYVLNFPGNASKPGGHGIPPPRSTRHPTGNRTDDNYFFCSAGCQRRSRQLPERTPTYQLRVLGRPESVAGPCGNDNPPDALHAA